MNYLCLVYLAHDKLHACPDSTCFAFAEELPGSGHFVAGQALQPTDTVSDALALLPKRYGAEHELVRLQDLNEAIHWASKIPPARYGSIEVRPVRELDVSDIAATQATV